MALRSKVIHISALRPLVFFAKDYDDEEKLFTPNHVKLSLVDLWNYTYRHIRKRVPNKAVFVQNIVGSVFTPYGNPRHKIATVA